MVGCSECKILRGFLVEVGKMLLSDPIWERRITGMERCPFYRCPRFCELLVLDLLRDCLGVVYFTMSVHVRFY